MRFAISSGLVFTLAVALVACGTESTASDASKLTDTPKAKVPNTPTTPGAAGALDGGTVTAQAAGDPPPFGPVVPPTAEDLADCTEKPDAAPLGIEESGGLPHTVRIVGTTPLLAAIHAWENRRVDCSKYVPASDDFELVDIDWGDRGPWGQSDLEGQPTLANGCSDLTAHAYTVPGTYRVFVQRFSAETFPKLVERLAATITVTGTARPTELSLDDLAGQTFERKLWSAPSDGEAIPFVWHWKPDRPLVTEVALVKEDGELFKNFFLCRAGFSGTSGFDFMFPHALVKTNEPVTLRGRVRLFDGQTLVKESVTGAFTFVTHSDI